MSIFNTPIGGSYVPTLTNVANVNTSACARLIYLKAGPVVVFGGLIQINPLGAGIANVDITLPFAVTFPDTNGLSGNLTSGAAVNVGSIQPDPPTLTQGRIYINAPGAGNVFWRLICIYLLT